MPLMMAANSLLPRAAKGHAKALKSTETTLAPSFLARRHQSVLDWIWYTGVCMCGYCIAALTNSRGMHMMETLTYCSCAGAKYHLEDVKAAMKEAMKGGSQGKVLLEG